MQNRENRNLLRRAQNDQKKRMIGPKKIAESLKKTAIFQKNNLDEAFICFVYFAQKSKGET